MKQKPGVMCLLEPWWRSLFTKNFLPITAQFFLNNNCNLLCSYCSVGKKDQIVTIETAKQVIEWIKSAGGRTVDFMGGEPLLLSGLLIEINRYAASRGCYTYLPTNLQLLTEQMAKKLAESKIGIFDVAVDSVTPLMPKNLDAIRKQMSILLRLQQQYNFSIKLNCMLTESGAIEIPELLDYSKKFQIPISFHLIMPSESNLPTSDQQEMAPISVAVSIQTALQQIIAAKKCGYYVINSLYHLFEIHNRASGGSPSWWPCLAGRLTISISTTGSLHPCFNLMNKDWGTVWQPNIPRKAELIKLTNECSQYCLSGCNYCVSYYRKHPLEWLRLFNHTKMKRK